MSAIIPIDFSSNKSRPLAILCLSHTSISSFTALIYGVLCNLGHARPQPELYSRRITILKRAFHFETCMIMTLLLISVIFVEQERLVMN